MPVTIAINGFGRIGRNVLRAIVESGRRDLRVVAINDLGPVETNAHLLEFDSVHGRFPGEIKTTASTIDAGQGPIRVTAIANPADLPWGDVDVALECTGRFTDRDGAMLHLKNGARRVLVSAPCAGADRTIVQGVNHDTLHAEDRIVSNASCTTNCLAPVARVLHENLGILRGFMTTIHSFTGDQPVLDTLHKDLYRARAAGLNMIPTTTGAARAVGLVLPALAGRLDGTAIRVPTPNVSAVDLSFVAARPTTAEAVGAMMAEAAEGTLRGILAVTHRELVSSDFNHTTHSAIFATDQTRVMDGTFCRVLCWYDNEWGFSNRMADTAAAMGALPQNPACTPPAARHPEHA